MRIEKKRELKVSAATAWELLGPNYTRAGEWASSVYVSAARPGIPKVDGAPVAGRTCETSLGPFTETIIAYDEARRYIAYSATGEKMPSFMRSLVNAWTIKETGPASCEVTMVLTADIAPPFNILMAPMMRMQFTGVLGQSLEEFAHYAETGKPHPRKVKADRSKAAAAARSQRFAA